MYNYDPFDGMPLDTTVFSLTHLAEKKVLTTETESDKVSNSQAEEGIKKGWLKKLLDRFSRTW